MVVSSKIAALVAGSCLMLGACTSDSDVEATSGSETTADGTSDGGSLTEEVSSNSPGFDVEAVSLPSGDNATLESLVDGDKPVLVWGWAPHCPNCRAEVADFNEIAAQGNVQVIGIGQTDDLELAKDFVTSTSPEFSVVYSEKGDLWDPVGVGFQKMTVYSADLTKKTEDAVHFSNDGFVGQALEELS